MGWCTGNDEVGPTFPIPGFQLSVKVLPLDYMGSIMFFNDCGIISTAAQIVLRQVLVIRALCILPQQTAGTASV